MQIQAGLFSGDPLIEVILVAVIKRNSITVVVNNYTTELIGDAIVDLSFVLTGIFKVIPCVKAVFKVTFQNYNVMTPLLLLKLTYTSVLII